MKKLQLKKEIVQDLDMLKIRGGDDTTTTRTIIGDSGGTNCGSCGGVCPTENRATACQKSCAFKCDEVQPQLTIEIYDCQSQACPTNPVSIIAKTKC